MKKERASIVHLVVNKYEKSDAGKGKLKSERKVMPGEGAPGFPTSRGTPFRSPPRNGSRSQLATQNGPGTAVTVHVTIVPKAHRRLVVKRRRLYELRYLRDDGTLRYKVKLSRANTGTV